MSKPKEWSGRIVVDNVDCLSDAGGYVQDCINYYLEHDKWPHCALRIRTGVVAIVSYEILKTGTMKITCYKEEL